MKWVVRENTESLCPELRVDDLPDKIPANVHILHNQGYLSIRSEDVAGVLPCKNGKEIIIKPKYDGIDPIALLMYINNISGLVVNRERLQSGKSEIDIQTIADAFIEQLALIRTETRKFKRIGQIIQTETVVGKVNWTKTCRQQQSGKINSIVTTVRASSYDIPENALISAAAKKVIGLYPTGSEAFELLFPWAIEADKCRHSYAELFAFQSKMNEKSLSGAHAYYYPSVMLSKIILGFDNVEIMSEEVDTILFNMPGLYEEFIRTGFQRAGGQFGCTIQKGLTPRSFLFYNGECEMIPDITIYNGINIKAILDVKYKIPDSKDYYQIFAYMKSTGLNLAYIISPSVEQTKVLTAFDGSKIRFVRINNSSGEELEEIAKRIIRDVM